SAVTRPSEDFFFEHLAGAFAARAWLLAIAAADRAILFECVVAGCAIRVFHAPHLLDLAFALAVLTDNVGRAITFAAGYDSLGSREYELLRRSVGERFQIGHWHIPQRAFTTHRRERAAGVNLLAR